jgi:thiol-disulfide isomerase/thioredoxin
MAKHAPAPGRRRPLAALVYGALALGAIAAPAAAGPLAPGEIAEIREMAGEALEKLVVHDEPRGPWEATFEGPDGEETSLAAFRGEMVVLNVWATWCPPCRKEMPSLDALAAETAGSDIRVVALSTDRGGAEPVRRFYEEEGIENLAVYVDAANRLPREAALLGLPVTMILDREGRELARLTGDAEWDDPEVVRLLRRMAELADDPVKEADAGETPAWWEDSPLGSTAL